MLIIQESLLLSLTNLDTTEVDLLLKNRGDVFQGQMLIHSTSADRKQQHYIPHRFTDLQFPMAAFPKDDLPFVCPQSKSTNL